MVSVFYSVYNTAVGLPCLAYGRNFIFSCSLFMLPSSLFLTFILKLLVFLLLSQKLLLNDYKRLGVGLL